MTGRPATEPVLATVKPHTAEDFDIVYDVATRCFRLIVIDFGNDETAPHWLEMIDCADPTRPRRSRPAATGSPPRS